MAVEDKRHDSDAPAKPLMKSRSSVMLAFMVLSLASNSAYRWRRETGICEQNWEVGLGLMHDIFGVADGEGKDPGVAAALRARFVEKKVFVDNRTELW